MLSDKHRSKNNQESSRNLVHVWIIHETHMFQTSVNPMGPSRPRNSTRPTALEQELITIKQKDFETSSVRPDVRGRE